MSSLMRQWVLSSRAKATGPFQQQYWSRALCIPQGRAFSESLKARGLCVCNSLSCPPPAVLRTMTWSSVCHWEHTTRPPASDSCSPSFFREQVFSLPRRRLLRSSKYHPSAPSTLRYVFLFCSLLASAPRLCPRPPMLSSFTPLLANTPCARLHSRWITHVVALTL